MSVTEIIDSFAIQPTTVTSATLGAVGLDSLDVVAMTLLIEDEFSLYISTERWTVNTKISTALGDVRDMLDPRN